MPDDSLRGLSIHQPGASAIVAGIQGVEIRTWSTLYRGRLYIHSGKKRGFKIYPSIQRMVEEGMPPTTPIPLGCIIGHVELVDVIPGDEEGSYHWVFEDPVFFDTFIPRKGTPMLMKLPLDLEDEEAHPRIGCVGWPRKETP